MSRLAQVSRRTSLFYVIVVLVCLYIKYEVHDVNEILMRPISSWRNRIFNIRKNGTKVILLWHPQYQTEMKLSEEIREHCPDARCIFTEDQWYLWEAEAIMFEGNKHYKIPNKQTGQIWIYVELESPAFRPGGIKQWNNLFNWTMTYRRDSDIPLFYGGVVLKKDKNTNVTPNVPLQSRKGILWFVSHCKTPGGREKFIENFKTGFSVDVFGKCGRKLDSGDPTYLQVPGLLQEKYKFYYAAENANCRDYITEKAFKSYTSFIIPLVRGGVRYDIYLPPSSFIDVNKFSTFDKLTDVLNHIGNAKEIYQSYFTYKQFYLIVDHTGLRKVSNPFCELCRKLHQEHKYKRIYENLHDWWKGNEKDSGYFCPKQELV